MWDKPISTIFDNFLRSYEFSKKENIMIEILENTTYPPLQVCYFSEFSQLNKFPLRFFLMLVP
jgi:hypothetical protein